MLESTGLFLFIFFSPGKGVKMGWPEADFFVLRYVIEDELEFEEHPFFFIRLFTL